MLRKVPMVRHELCYFAYVAVTEEFNEVVMGRFTRPDGWEIKYFKSQKYHKAEIIKIDTDDTEDSYDEDILPMYFDTTDSDGTRIRWSTKKGRFGKPVAIWPKGSTFSIWKNGKYVNEKE